MKKEKNGKQKTGSQVIGRRGFMKICGVVSVGAPVLAEACLKRRQAQSGVAVQSDIDAAEHAPSEGYLVVDIKKCQGCLTCMLACTLAHEGNENLSLARIQILQTPYDKFPDDLTIEPCRQCLSPACVKSCPTGAMHVDSENGNVRTVDAEQCIGCLTCVGVCPHKPSRAIWDFQKGVAMKCDLCAEAPYWSEQGGPGGKQACVEACPLGGVSFQRETPEQDGDDGYNVNLRGEAWKKLGYPTD
ncbi:MAG: 4Fe-4S dicluster domain-containing protein [Deltaproteobacteria bacterium]|nr:4Fe-4S dicluster domain-containing protein [Deltaproteobacteria bacterium]